MDKTSPGSEYGDCFRTYPETKRPRSRARIRLFDSVESDMRERDAARAAQTKVGKGDWIPRPTKAEILADVPGARNVKPELLPEGVQHLSNVSVGVVAADPIGRRDY